MDDGNQNIRPDRAHASKKDNVHQELVCFSFLKPIWDSSHYACNLVCTFLGLFDGCLSSIEWLWDIHGEKLIF